MGPAASELFMTHAGRLPSACLPPLPGRSLAVYWQSSGIKLARPLLFPHPHRPRRVHQGLALILILFKRGKSDSTVSSEAIYTPPLATAPTPFVWCAIKSINRKFLQGKPDCCSIRERRTAIHLHRRLWPAQLALILLPMKANPWQQSLPLLSRWALWTWGTHQPCGGTAPQSLTPTAKG